MLRIPVVLLAVLALTVAGTASAKTPCWKKVLADWSDNETLDHSYSIACYRAALKHIPEDMLVYTSIQDDIYAAMQSHGRPQTPGHASKGPSNSKGIARPSKSATSRAAAGLNASGANSLPLPLIVLGSMALALLGSAGGLRLIRLLQGRRARPGSVRPAA